MFGAKVALPRLAQALQLLRIGPHDPTVQSVALLSCPHQATLDPGEYRGTGHGQRLSQLYCPPFIRTECRAGVAMPVDVAQSHLAAQRVHTHRTPATPAMPAAQRWVTLGHQLVGNG